MNSRSLSVAFLILVNLIPIYGVLYLGWDLFSIMLLYWMENVIIGFFNILKMTFASKSEEAVLATTGKKLFMIPFFTVHYGIFCLVHGVFVVTLFGGGGPFSDKSPFDYIFANPLPLSNNVYSWALFSMVLSHGISLVINFFGQKEYLKMSVEEQMFQPYQRIIILHVTILFGGFLTMNMGAPVLAMILMALLKIVVDVWAHLQEHKNL